MEQIKNWAYKNKKLVTFLAVSFILIAMFFVAFLSSKGAFGDPGDSGIVDEVAHIPAGFSYIKDLDYRFNPEHPPLAKALAGAMLVIKGFVGPDQSPAWNDLADLNGAQWKAGWDMIFKLNSDPQAVFFWARLPLMLLMIGLGLFLFKWARELFGTKVGLIVLLLYSLYPDVLAHGRLVTTDIAAAFGFVIATYYFDKALIQKTWKWIIIAALAFALAQLLKFSAFLLFGIFLILAVIRAVMDHNKGQFWSKLWQNFKPYFFVCIISIIFVWIVYIPFTWKMPVNVEHQAIEDNLTQDPRTVPLRNFLHHFEGNTITRGLGHYILGIFLVIGRVEGGNGTFILGHFSDKSISWYFPVAWILKTPIPIIIMSFSAILWLILAWPKDRVKKWQLALILTPILVYWGFTLKGQLDIGIRHLLPTVPFVLLLIGYSLHEAFKTKRRVLFGIITAVLVIYMAVSTLSNYPNFIAYFNEFTPRDLRYTRLIDSSLDWGQDLLRLKKYVDDNHIDSIKVDYFGGSNQSYYIPQQQGWSSEYGPTTGWLAVSATFYQLSKLRGPAEGKWSYAWLDNIKPTAEIGGSILVFHISDADLAAHPPQSPYPIMKSSSVVNPIFNAQ